MFIIFISDLSALVRATYEAEGGSDTAIIKDLGQASQVLRDDVGVQHVTKSEWMLLN